MELAKQVKSLFNEQGPLCDSEGFYNHVGECWNDALQMIFLNSDYCKENVQKKLALGEIDPSEVETIFEPVLEKKYFPEMVKEDFIRKWIGLITLYLETLQNRFRRHYITESLRLGQARTQGVCSLEDAKGEQALKEMLKLSMAFRAKGKEGPLAAFAGQSFIKYDMEVERSAEKLHEIYKPGGEPTSEKNVSMIFKHFFSIPFSETIYRRDLEATYLYRDSEKKPFSLKETTFAVFISSHPIRQRGNGHATCFYTCGNREYFFDDNYGSIQFPWKKALKFLGENQRNDSIINLYFDGVLKISDPSGKVLFEHDGYPMFVFTYLGKRGEKGKQFYSTFLWNGTEIRVIIGKTDIEEYIYERKLGENTLTFQFNEASNATHSLLTYDIEAEYSWLKPEIKEFVKGRMNEQTGHFIGTRLNVYKTRTQETRLDEQLKKISEGKAKIDDFFYEENEEQYNPLLYALHLNNIGYVQKVLDMGADIKVRGVNDDDVLCFAMAEDVSLDILQLLVEKGADVNSKNMENKLTPLMVSVIYNVAGEGEEIVKFLLEKGADVNMKSKPGYTVMEYALARNRFHNIIELLEKHGAKEPTCPTQEEILSGNILMKALQAEKLVRASIIARCYRELELFDEMNRENLVGDTPLKMLIKMPFDNWAKNTFKIFMRSGAEVNYVDRFGGTPLHYAIMHNNVQIAKALIDEGAKLNLIARGLGSPLDYAKRLGDEDMIRLIEKEDRDNRLPYQIAVPSVKRKLGKPISKNKLKVPNTFLKRPTKKVTNMPRPAVGGRKTRRKY